MQIAAEMDLPVLAIEDPGFPSDLTARVEEARRIHPWLGKFHLGGREGYVIFGHQATRDLLSTDERMRPFFDGIVEHFGAQGTDWAEFMTSILPTLSGEDHRRLHSSVAHAFTPRQAAATKPLMQTIISNLLDEWVPNGQFDFADFAAKFPIAVMCGLLGVAPASTERLHEALETQVSSASLGNDILPKLLDGYRTMYAYADSVIFEREAEDSPGEDLIGMLIEVKTAGKLDEKELRHMLIVLLLGGYDTSKNMLTMVVYLAMQQPDIWNRCADEPAYCRSVVEEALRHSGILVPIRLVTYDIEYDGVVIPKGAMLCFALPLTGRDPTAFANPDTFDPERKFSTRHFAFGRGEHTCIGQHLARVQIEEALHQIAQRLRNPRLAGEIEWRPFLGAGGLRRLPIAFDAG